jgi:hypothetical protein
VTLHAPDPDPRAADGGRRPGHAPAHSTTGLSRWKVAVLGLVGGVVAALVAIVVVGGASLCGFSENQTPSGYCAASAAARAFLVAVPVLTVIGGFVLSLRAGRLTPVAIAGLCAIAEGLIALGFGY